jgi:glycosyltransferase involved in cell wall biosynthesis
MRICFVAHNFIRGNGQGRINAETAKYAARQGHAVTLLADRVDPGLVAEPNVTWDRVPQRPQRPNLAGVWSFATAADWQVRRRRAEFDVIVGAGYTLTEPHDVNLCQFVHRAWLASPVHVARLSRGPWAWYQWAYSRANARWEELAYAHAGVVVAPSEKIRAELVSIGVQAGRTAVICNGVDPDEFHPRPTAEADPAERAALGLPAPGDGVLAMFAGDIRTRRKNLDTVLASLAALPGVRLVVVGDATKSPFPALARELGVADRVTFLGFRRDISRVMRAADVFVFPSRYEAGTLVLTEAAASGLPLVTAATAGGAEVFGPEVAETIADPDDVPALTAAIRRFTADPTARRGAALAARAAAERLTWAEMARRYLELFEAAARRGSRPITVEVSAA